MLFEDAIIRCHYGLIVLIDVLRLAGTADVGPPCTAGNVTPYPIAPGLILWPEGRAVFAIARVVRLTDIPWLVRCSRTIGQAPIIFFFGICGTDPGT